MKPVKRRKYKKNFYEPMYGTELVLLVGYTNKEFQKYLKKEKIGDKEWDKPFSDAALFTIEEENGYRSYLMWLEEMTLRSLSHETMHMVIRICHHLGIPIGIDNTEAISYLYEYWITKLAPKKL